MNNKRIYENFLKNQKGMKFRIKQPKNFTMMIEFREITNKADQEVKRPM